MEAVVVCVCCRVCVVGVLWVRLERGCFEGALWVSGFWGFGVL